MFVQSDFSVFFSTTSFSNVTFDLAAHVVTEDTEGRKVALNFDSLFNVDVKPFRETLEFISTSRKHPWPPIALDPMFKPREKEVVFNKASNILVPLCEEVLLEKRAQGALSFIFLGGLLPHRLGPPPWVSRTGVLTN